MDVLDRLHTRLRRALEARGGRMDEPFTVAELYQQLIPYRAVRGELALLELAPYEHALLRLLAGERDYLTLSDTHVVEDLRRELREPNPILGVYRDYAEVRVWLAAHAPGAGESVGEADDGVDVTLDGATHLSGFVAPPLKPALPVSVPAAAAPDRAGEVGGQSRRTGGPNPARVSGAAAGACVACEEPLPQVEGLRFCPACGVEQKERGCEGCGAAVQAGWLFCVHCGQQQRRASSVTAAAGE
jgi:hypothetical protein